jgi:hypothetical protein
MEGEELSVLVGDPTPERVDRILKIALGDLPVALRTAGVFNGHSEAVGSRVLEAIWRLWIPEARRRLASGSWTPECLRSKLRTALIQYARTKRIDEQRSELSLRSALDRLKRTPPTNDESLAEPDWGVTRDEARVIRKIRHNKAVRKMLKNPDRKLLKRGVQTILLLFRATDGRAFRPGVFRKKCSPGRFLCTLLETWAGE